MIYTSDIITAISTPIGHGAIGIVRLSGIDAFIIADKLFVSSKGKKIAAQRSHTILFGNFKTTDGKIIDNGLVSIFKSPNSYTGEDMVELNCHSNPLILNSILDELLKLGARLADSGEFTKRAYLNGKIDLTAAQAISNIMKAKTMEGLTKAAKFLHSDENNVITDSAETLMKIIVNLEAMIDFPDEDTENPILVNLERQLDVLIKKISDFVEFNKRESIFINGIRCSIIGKANSGKSTLLNSLLKKDRVIVSNVPGTTRDIVSELIDIKGIPFLISDTAGISDKPDELESIGIKKTKEESYKSDISLVLLDGSKKFSSSDEHVFSLVADKDLIIVINKCDLDEIIENDFISNIAPDKEVIRISAKFGTNIEELKEKLVSKILDKGEDSINSGFSCNYLYNSIIKESFEHMMKALKSFKDGLSIEFIAEDLNASLRSLGKITGKITSDDLLNEIFSSFCIGK
jgi:tRNA modification GTPase